jgi:hypothetical protein
MGQDQQQTPHSLLRILASSSHLSHDLSQIDVFFFENLHLHLQGFFVRFLVEVSLFELIALKRKATVSMTFPTGDVLSLLGIEVLPIDWLNPHG